MNNLIHHLLDCQDLTKLLSDFDMRAIQHTIGEMLVYVVSRLHLTQKIWGTKVGLC